MTSNVDLVKFHLRGVRPRRSAVKRRTLTACAAGLVAAVLMAVAACGGGSSPTPAAAAAAAPAPGTVSDFVGSVDGTRHYVAVVLKGADDVEVYVCDGTGASESYVGKVADGRIALTSADGDSTVDATSDGTTVRGTVALAGQSRTFAATRVRDVGGLYELTAFIQGERALAVGRSASGNQYTRDVGPDGAVATFLLADGTTRPAALFRTDVQPPPATDNFVAYRVIVADDGTSRGSPKTGAAQFTAAQLEDTGGKWLCYDLDM